MSDQITSNWVCWAIITLALYCYQQLWARYFHVRAGEEALEDMRGHFLQVLIGALPLLGLLGTIIGLLDSFDGMARFGAGGALLSGGIADALLTTQLGLLCAIPAWLFQAYIRTVAERVALASLRAGS